MKVGRRPTDETLWHSPIGGLSSPPETFMLDGKQRLLARRPSATRNQST